MATIEKLQLLQDELFENIRKAERNFRKTPKDRIKVSYLETRLEVLDDQYKEFKEGHKNIVSLTKDKKEVYFTENKYENFEEIYVQYKTSLRETLGLLLPSSRLSRSVASTSSVIESNYDVKLPRINLPTFSGKYEEWQTFYDMFTSLIHDNKNLTSVQKLHYLKGNLTGEAQNLLRNYSITDANYDGAWKQLVERYDNKRYNCNAILKVLFSLKKINTESSQAIKYLLDTTSSCLQSLENMGIDITTWDVIIVFLVVSKLDPDSMKLWEQHLNTIGNDLPTWNQLKAYLENRFRSLEMIDSNTVRPSQYIKPISKAKSFHMSVESKQKNNEVKCALCHENHYIYHCKQFENMTPRDRQDFVQSNHLCFNCLSSTHAVLKCKRPMSCRKCRKRHHTMLHFEREPENEITKPTNEATLSATSSSLAQHIERASTSRGDTHITSMFSGREVWHNHVLLATARVKVYNNISGCKLIIRALLDQGSQASFITEATAQFLELIRKPVSGFVSGLGDGRMRIKHMVSLRVESRHNPDKAIQINAYVLHSLTSLIPAANLSVSQWSAIGNLPLADPTYATPNKIDILLGAEVYGEILLDGVIKQPNGSLIAQNTMFGWILSGRAGEQSEELEKTITSMHVQLREDDLLKQFWEMENEPNLIQKKLTESEKKCEEFFNSTTERDEEGRFVVKLPFATDDPKCQYGNSRAIAIKRLEILERKLLKDTKLREEYNQIMSEYLRLNHMTRVKENGIENPKAVYLPHHAVVREDKETTKVRVVFDASSKGDNGVSLNDNLLVGPRLQQDLRHILMRWRSHRVAVVADIVKMYRMVRVADEDTDFQRIVWRFSCQEPIQHFKLLRLTFGTASAPYLAVKCLQKLADLEEEKYPLAARIAKQDFLMDDLISGADNEFEALQIYSEMNEVMKSAGFELQKWNSNSKSLLQKFGKSDKINQDVPIKLNKSIKILGVSWNRETDTFEYVLNISDPKEQVTKRQVLSDVARLYDPLGWIAPVVITAKILIQKLWKSGLDWDEYLTEELHNQWSIYRSELLDLKQLTVPRWTGVTPYSKVELHVFSDASKSAYAAAVYVRVIDEANSVHVHLVTAKTKVAPIEREISIPRLELCGAALAAKLIFEVSQVIGVPKENLFGWTDSTIVLAWLKGGPSRWSTFVSNRVSTILNILDFEQWNHVSSQSNPADCASRGLSPDNLLAHSLWWNGPHWLTDKTIYSEIINIEDTQEEERVQTLTISLNTDMNFIWSRFSSLQRLLRVISYCRRILNLRLPRNERLTLPKYITLKEMNETFLLCIKQVQESQFAEDIKQLKTRGNVQKKSSLRTLCPFLDERGILRVSGRINQSDVSYDTRHPMIIPAKSHFTRLIIIDVHFKTLHGGPQIMLNVLRAKYWILRAKDQVKRCFRECVTCSRYSTRKSNPFMGILPEARIKPSKPFKSTGVDYCGPINIRFSPGRGAKSFKGYICLFVCMVTRAVHLEAVTDLTSKGFIAAFRRFISRRGHCQDLFSDNGTNFVGADREMREMFNSAKSSLHEEIASLLTLEHTTWHYIPPHTPNFGGIWEAGVRSTKNHLRKVIGNHTLTFEEITTVLTQVEACLNSRPISLLSDDPNDPLPLTPGHFLIGEPLLNLADDNNDCNIIGLDRWRLTQKIVSDFWKKWYKEYLVNLNQRYRWNKQIKEPEIDQIVVLKEDNIPPSKWILGRILRKHTGQDGVTRVVTIKCKSGVLKRPVSKLCFISK